MIEYEFPFNAPVYVNPVSVLTNLMPEGCVPSPIVVIVPDTVTFALKTDSVYEAEYVLPPPVAVTVKLYALVGTESGTLTVRVLVKFGDPFGVSKL